MSASPELQKLAHTLDVDLERVMLLAGLSDEDLRTLRGQVAESLFRAGRPAFSRVAALSKAVPTAVSAKLAQVALPPLLAARTAELLEPAKAADLVGRVSESYLADISSFMDASRAPEVVAAIPPAKVAAVAAELARRGEWVVIGGFVSQVDGTALRASLEVFDGEQLLRIGYVLDDPARLDEISGMLTDEQVDSVIAAAPAHGLWPELSTMLAHLAPARAERLATRFAAAGGAVHTSYDEAVASGDLTADERARLGGS